MNRLAMIALGLFLSFAQWARGAERPNILFIFTDDQSHRTVSCYPEAYSWVDTPHIDSLAAQGVRFTHAYIGTWCMPSRATMLTGHHPFGVESMRMEGEYPASVYDPEKCPFWPKIFRQHGYTTAYPDAQVPEPADIYPGPTRSDKPEYVRERNRWRPNSQGEVELDSGVQQRTVVNAPIHGNSLQDWVRQYHQGVLAIDEAVGRLRKAVEESGQADNTLIVFAADQGIAWGQKGFQQKIAPYDANIRGPLIMSFPGRIPSGGVCPTPVGGTDLPPTFFSFADLPLPWKMHGHDLTPLLKSPDRPWEHPVLTVLTGQKYGSDTDFVPTDPQVLYETAKVPWWVSLMQGRHKYIRTLVEGEVEELYDLENDPEELVNLALVPEHLAKLRSMRAATIAELRRTDAGMVERLPAFSTPH